MSKNSDLARKIASGVVKNHGLQRDNGWEYAIALEAALEALRELAEPSQDEVERVARAICAASCDTWREPPYNRLHTDSLNNHWRGKARAALAALGREEPVAELSLDIADKALSADDWEHLKQ